MTPWHERFDFKTGTCTVVAKCLSQKLLMWLWIKKQLEQMSPNESLFNIYWVESYGCRQTRFIYMNNPRCDNTSWPWSTRFAPKCRLKLAWQACLSNSKNPGMLRVKSENAPRWTDGCRVMILCCKPLRKRATYRELSVWACLHNRCLYTHTHLHWVNALTRVWQRFILT